MDNDEIIRRSQAACEALSADDDGLKRQVLTHAGNRWSLGIVHVLGLTGACAMPRSAGAWRASPSAC